MKAQELREIGSEELSVKLEELQKKLFEMRSQSVTEKLENTKAIRNVKKDIARIKTILNESK